MVVLNRIYTRTGDGGETALVDGSRVPKDAPRVAAYGTVDELNATLGLARLHGAGAIAEGIARVQNDLFDLGADLATPEKGSARRERLRILATQVSRLESEIDELNANLAPLTSFVLPAGTPAAATLHVCRTVARRAERVMVALTAGETVNSEALRYINRLSDLLFVAARVANRDGKDDVLWTPGENR
jgi:cob(I)alamin adenosyltransferase